MIVQKDFLNKLKDFGLNTYESKLWTALLARGVSTAGELSDIANVPRSRSYDVLESLERKGFIVMKLGKPIKYIAVTPSEVIERVKRKIKDEADNQTQLIETLKTSEVLEELNLLHKKGITLIEPAELTASIKGRNNIYHHIESMIKNAKKSILLVSTEEGIQRKIEFLKPLLQKAKQRGVKIKILAPLNKKTEVLAKDLKSFAEWKENKDTKARFCIIDGKEIIFMLMNDSETHSNYDVGIWVNAEFFVNSLDSVMSSLWKTIPKAKI